MIVPDPCRIPAFSDIAPYTPGKKSPVAGGWTQGVQACRRTRRRFGPSPQSHRGLQGRRRAHLEDYPEGTSRVASRGDRPWPSGSIRTAHHLRRRLRRDFSTCWRAPPISVAATRRSVPRHGFLVYPIATMANGATNVVAPRNRPSPPTVDAVLKLVLSPRTKLVWLANPNNPTGHLFAVRRSQAACARRIAAAGAAGARRRLFRLRVAQRLRTRPSKLVATTDNTVMTHTLLQDSRPRGAADRLDVSVRAAHSSTRVNRIRGPFNVSTPAMLARRRCDRGQPRISKCRKGAITSTGATG